MSDERDFRVWAPERYSVPYRVKAINKEHAIAAVKHGERQTPMIAREEGYEKEMVFEGFFANSELWDAEEITVEDKLDAPRQIKELAEEACDVQGAVNFYALTGAFRKAIEELKKNDIPIEKIVHHPVTRAWMSKLIDLCGLDNITSVWASGKIYDLAYPTVEKELDSAVQGHEAGS